MSYTILSPSSPDARASGLCALAMMIKAPRAGSSKTRLAPPLSHEEAAHLSLRFLRDTAENIARACDETGGAAMGVACYTPVGAESAFDELLPAGFALLAQRGETFGERLSNATFDLLAVGYASLCLIDSDSPTLPTAALVAAVAELSRPGDRCVLGPADDGGYYLIGVKGAHRQLFERIDWSTGRVARQTVERAEELSLPVALLPAWYDVDDATTLTRLCAELFGARRGGEAGPSRAGETDPRRTGSGAENCADALRGYEAPHTRDFLARLIGREGRARVWGVPSDETAERATECGGGASRAESAP